MKRLLFVLALISYTIAAASQTDDTSKLSLAKAKEYFASGKYHESLIEFTKLDKEYNLSTHYYAYMGLCFYKENDYEKACSYYAKALEYIKVCAPSERSIYLYTLGESNFKLGKYEEAEKCFENMLDVCKDEEKADVYYHIGFCQFFTGEHQGALHSFRMSLKCYSEHPHYTGTAARISQLNRMNAGLENELSKNKETNDTKQ